MRSIVAGSIALALFASSAIAGERQNSQRDSCRAQLPPALVTSLATAFPGYRAPFEADNLQEDIAYNRAHGGNGCISIVTADFDGVSRMEYLVALTALRSDSGVVVVARDSNRGWLFHELTDWPNYRNRLFVDFAEPGRFQRTDALDSPVTGAERQSMTCRYSGAVVGETESTSVVYCFIKGTWHWVQTSD